MSRRRSLFRRALFAAGVTVGLLLVAIVAGVFWLATTTAGFDWLMARARPHLPDSIAIESIEGRLIGPIEIEGLRVRGKERVTRIERVQLEWTPLALLGGRVRIERLAIEGVTSRRTKPAEPLLPLPELPPAIDIGLPLAVTIEQLAIDDLVSLGAGGTARRIDRLRARLQVGAETVRLTDVTIDAPRYRLAGRLRVGAQQPYPVDGRIDWRARPSGQLAAMAGQLTLDGSLRDLDLVQRWTAPSHATVTANLRLFRDRPEWRARVALPRTRLVQWWSADRDAIEDWTLAADLHLRGSLTEASVAGVADLDGLPIGAVRTRVAATADAEHVLIERLRLEPARPNAWLRASGEIEFATDPRFDLTFAWENLAWPLGGDSAEPPAIRSRSGQLQIKGTADEYHLSGEARLDAPARDVPPARLAWEGTGSTDGFKRLHVEAGWREARITADGQAHWAGAGGGRFDLAVHEVDPGWFVSSLRGRLGARASIRAEWGRAPTAALTLHELTGELNGNPIGGQARAAYRDETIRIEALQLKAGDARLKATGTLGADQVSLDWDVAIPHLKQLLPRAGGRIEGHGSVIGERDAPTIRFEVEAADVWLGGTAVDALHATGELRNAGREDSRVDLAIQGARAGEIAITRLDARLRGSRADHRLDLQLAADQGTATIRIEGALAGRGWNGRLLQAELDPARRPAWQLQAPTDLAWQRDARFRLHRACWASREARLCVQASGTPDTWRTEIDARAMPVARIARYWRDDLSYSGRFRLSAEIEGGGGLVTGAARLQFTPGHIAGMIDETRTVLLDYRSGHIEATLARQRIDAVADFSLAGGGRLAATVGLGRGAARTLDGRMRAEIHDLGLVGVLLPVVDAKGGELRADLRLDGTISAPRLSGEAALRAERVAVRPLGIEVSALKIDLETADRAFTVAASAHSGEGMLSANMEVTLENGGRWRARGAIEGEGFTAVDLPEAHVVVTPDLRWRVEDHKVAVEGRVTIPSARIEPRDLSGTVRTSPDAVIVAGGERQADAEASDWRVGAEVTVVVGEDVRFEAFGLDARLGGEIHIVQQPGQLTRATGELRVIEGTYTVYRQTLTIDQGRVLFTGGPIANPGLDITAIRRPREVLVGVHVRGTLREPRVELFSDPPMEESQILSYLLLGVPLRETSTGERSTVAAAAAAIASSRQGTRLARELGFDTLTVEEDETGPGASLVLGRYLSPRLYVGYGIGLLEQADSVRLRYQIDEQWTLEAESGATSGADLLYSIETD